jgi:hypothetical protein
MAFWCQALWTVLRPEKCTSKMNNFWTSDVLIRTSQSRKLLAQKDKFEKKLL